jgi:hypothetical protein
MPAPNQHPSLTADPFVLGFHGLKVVWRPREFLRRYCEILTPAVRQAAGKTREQAALCLRSARGKSYLGLKRKPRENLPHQEVALEHAMYQKWSQAAAGGGCGWHRIVDYQVPVKDRERSPLGLKAIDLLGVDASGLPVVIELKIVRRETGADTPLLALLEAASYACVLLADWPHFRTEFERQRERLRVGNPIPDTPPEGMSLVVAGPPEYWTFFQNKVGPCVAEARPAFRALVDALRTAGFPVTFACVEGPVQSPDQLSVTRARFLED